MTSSPSKSIAIVGGGPVGALAALYFAKHFEKVTLYELRAGLDACFSLVNPQIRGSRRIETLFRANRLTLPFQTEELRGLRKSIPSLPMKS